MNQKRTKLLAIVVCGLALSLIGVLSTPPVEAATTSVSPIMHIEIRVLPSVGGKQVTQIWYHRIPNKCSLNDILIATVTLQICQYTITTCWGGYCYSTNKNYCTDFLKDAIKRTVQLFYQSVTVLLYLGPPIVITMPWWVPLL